MKQGGPATLLTADGKLYLLVPESDEDMGQWVKTVSSFASQKVKISGKLHSKGGLNLLVVKTISK